MDRKTSRPWQSSSTPTRPNLPLIGFLGCLVPTQLIIVPLHYFRPGAWSAKEGELGGVTQLDRHLPKPAYCVCALAVLAQPAMGAH